MARWTVYAKKADFRGIAERFGIDQVTARLLRNREVNDDDAIRTYLSGDLSMLHDGRKMLDMEKAALLVADAVRDGERIRIIGDYDVDGICATYILCRGLEAAGCTTMDAVLPDRIRDGYGLNASFVRQAAQDKVNMLLTCDNGISALDEIALAKELGIRVVVTDHHEPVRNESVDHLPPADAVVDPKREGDPYPFREICGAVVAWKFISILLPLCRAGDPENDGEFLKDLLVFAAFATNCDVMPLVDENRIIMKYGLLRIAGGNNAGLQELIHACGLKEDRIRASDFGFRLGPCLNSTGRLDSAHRGLQLLMTTDRTEAARIAGDLVAINEERKILDGEAFCRACEVIEDGGYETDRILIVYLPDCHESLAGIVAGKVRERYGKPAVVFTDCAEEGMVKGSARSVPGVNIHQELSAQEQLFTRFGGHEQAAGLTMPYADLEKLRKALNDNREANPEPVLHIDMEMPLSYVTMDLVRQFSILEPFGKGNPEPLFVVRDLAFYGGRLLGKNGSVAIYKVRDPGGRSYELKAFKSALGMIHDRLTDCYGAQILTKLYDRYTAEKLFVCHVVYRPQINVWQERESLEFQIVDIMIQ